MIISKIIQTLSPEDRQRFKSYLRQKNKRTDTKNLALFQLLLQQPPPQHPDVILYGKPSRNAYHALCKRLHDALIDFIAGRSFETETSEELDVLKLLLAGRIFYEHNQPTAAFKTLRKAERKALEHDLYSILSEIYHTQIQYAHLHKDIPLDSLTALFYTNQERHEHQENLNLAYAYLKQQLWQEERNTQQPLSVLLENTFQKFHITIDGSLTYKSLYQLLEIVNTVAHLEHNFAEALPFFESIYAQIQQKKSVLRKHHYYQIHFLYYMANAYFRNRQFSVSRQYLQQMYTQMAAEGGKYEARFRESALLLYTLNLNYTGEGLQAIDLLNAHFLKHPTPDPDLILSQIVFYAQQERFKEALRSLNTLKHTDTWYQAKMGEDWLIKRDLIALIIHIELEHIDLTDSLLRRFKRRYNNVIHRESRLQHFLRLLSIVHHHPEELHSSAFRESVKQQFTATDRSREDLFMLSYFAWLKARITATPLYQTTLDLL